MVPIHESDLAENRWKESQWSYYELWERVEQRFRRKRALIIFGVVVLFLALSSIPIVQDRYPKWAGFAAARRLATELDRLKLESAELGRPVRIEVSETADGIHFRTSRVDHCGSEAASEALREGDILKMSSTAPFAILRSDVAEKLGLKTMQTSFCYSPLSQENLSDITIGILPAKDLTEGRLDRLSLVRLTGASADISFD